MRVYRFHLPDKSNDAKTDYRSARHAWLNDALRMAGGATALGKASGVWRDPSDGKVYWETMWVYEVAIEDEFGEDTRRGLVNLAKIAFPDQLAIYSAEVGQAWIE